MLGTCVPVGLAVIPFTCPVLTSSGRRARGFHCVCTRTRDAPLGRAREAAPGRAGPDLDSRFFVNQKHHRISRRIDLEPNDLGAFPLDVRIAARHVALEAARLEPARFQTRVTVI